MSQDIVADALNEIMNAKKARKSEIIIDKNSKLLKNVLDIAKERGYLNYSLQGNKIKIELKNLNEIKAVKPRYTVSVKKINGYVRRFLPAKNFGLLVISTNEGLMSHEDAEEKNVGGCIIAYMF
ncbi:MAG: 30S ribosomal protein S8 [Candidatus Nanoarchaeia archaeon]|nr:30S ribosomal protein S8 [Candidatus Nanoarchaeia archaeon]MDD5741725.1 30S ribosomal protein S8 [Candidatus Nanoarchaeia archaeon]